MQNILVSSLGSGCGKSSVILAMLALFAEHNLHYYPFKPISITSDIVFSQNIALPYEVFIMSQYLHAPNEVLPLLCPLLFVPTQDAPRDTIHDTIIYRLYNQGKYVGLLSGQEIKEGVKDELRQSVHQSYFILCHKANLVIEDIGDRREMETIFRRLTDHAIEYVFQMFVARPTDLSIDFVSNNYHIITKAEKEHSSTNANRCIGCIPYCEEINDLSTLDGIRKWNEFVKQNINIRYLIELLC